MKSLYEQKWIKAIEGAKIEPSEALWDKIASELDSERGRNYWVTILMIAATVTLAFSFPLTIGDSTFKARQHSQEYIGYIEKNNSSVLNSTLDASDNKLAINQSQVIKNGNTKSVYIEREKGFVNNSTHSNNKLEDHEKLVPINKASDIQTAIVKGIGLTSLHWENNYVIVTANDYYFIPFYIPLKKYEDRNLVASLNMGTGSSSSGNSLFGNFDLESSDAASFSDLNNATNDSHLRKETKGTTFYIGTALELPIGKHWSLLAGIAYLAKRTEGFNNIVLTSGDGYRPLGANDPIKLGSIFLSDSYHYSATNNYISVPVSFKYPLISRKITVRAGAGISTDFMLSHIVNSETYGKASYSPTDIEYKSVVLSGLINLDISYRFSEKYSIAFETGFRMGITPIDKNKKLYPSSFTVGIVLFYKLR